MALPWARVDHDHPTHYAIVDSPVGELLVTGVDGALTRVLFSPFTIEQGWLPDDGSLANAIAQLADYFAGARREFDLPLAPQGTAFQQGVWSELTQIPYGQTRSYGQIAAALGHPTASRAVGAANGQNPIAVVVPCHRVIGSSGRLTGYAGGLDRKRVLLELEAPSSPLIPALPVG